MLRSVVGAMLAILVLGLAACSRNACDSRSRFALEGKLVHGDGHSVDDGKIYIIVSGERRWISAWPWIEAHGFTSSDILTRPSAELACYPEGAPLP